MLLMDTWGSQGDANNKGVLFTVSNMGTKQLVAIRVPAISS